LKLKGGIHFFLPELPSGKDFEIGFHAKSAEEIAQRYVVLCSQRNSTDVITALEQKASEKSYNPKIL
jgi:hypothetical protein